MKIFEVVELSENTELADKIVRAILKRHAALTQPNATTSVSSLGSAPGSEEPGAASIADFSKVKKPSEVAKITSDAVATARENDDLAAIAQVVSAGAEHVSNVATPKQKGEEAQAIISQLSTQELNDPRVKLAVAPLQLQVKMANLDTADGEAGAEEALRQFVQDSYAEIIPQNLRAKVPLERFPQTATKMLVDKAQKLGMMSAFQDPMMAVKIIKQEVAKLSKVDKPAQTSTSSGVDTTDDERAARTNTAQAAPKGPFTTKNIPTGGGSRKVEILDASGKVVATVTGNRQNIKRNVKAKLQSLEATG